MEEDMEVHHDDEGKPAQALTKVGDAMPGLGIVAAVLGVVITMGAIDGAAVGNRRARSARRSSARSSAF
ncbi:MAG: hypothetical protein QM736_03725 [Vicinamibacterales bacterium]